MRRTPTEPLRLFAFSALSGTALALLLLGVWAIASGTGPLLITTAHALGAVMLVSALSGLFGCAAFATRLGMDEHRPGGGLLLRRTAPARAPRRSPNDG